MPGRDRSIGVPQWGHVRDTSLSRNLPHERQVLSIQQAGSPMRTKLVAAESAPGFHYLVGHV